MKPTSARVYFDQLAAIGRQARLRNTVGTCEFAITGAGTWCVAIDHGDLRVSEGPAKTAPEGRLSGDEATFLRVVRGDDDDDIVCAVLRGAIAIEGEIAFLQKLRVLTALADAR